MVVVLRLRFDSKFFQSLFRLPLKDSTAEDHRQQTITSTPAASSNTCGGAQKLKVSLKTQIKMNKPAVIFGVATLLACSLCSVSAGTLKAAAAEAISIPTPDSNSKFEARGLIPSPPLHGNEAYTGPPVIALALPVALLLVVALWVAAYNTLRSPPPKIGYNAGLVESAGWGGQQASTYVSGGWGYDAAASEQQQAAGSIQSQVAVQSVAQSAGAPSAAGVAAAGRAFDDLTHRVARSIERHEQAQN
ncbi:hypothetical protein Ocin01_10454 [Orchesella cincta]|uniref:Uncharacterized protein n=1 Tax=Orchesella cincta TaxID=48709 RepID=A0A1D2MT07_ORCCI|nr:hypothetical protein Ocin01_10454 [Orchesella cincta]